MSHVTCQVSGVTFFLSGGVSLLRVCYQWGLPRLVFIISRDFKIYPVQCSTVQNRGRSAVHYIAVHCKSAICYTVKFNAVQGIELLCIETICIFCLVWAMRGEGFDITYFVNALYSIPSSSRILIDIHILLLLIFPLGNP